MSTHPVLTFLKYIDATNSNTSIATGGVCVLATTVPANTWSSGLALRLKFTKGSSFTVQNVRLWMNDTVATLNGGEIDISDWSFHYKYTGPDGVAITDMQTGTEACVAAAITTGDQSGWAAIPQVLGDAIVLSDISSVSAATTIYSRFIGLSFKPTTTAQDGTYTNFSAQVRYEFS